MAQVNLKRITKRYPNGFQAVNEVNLEIESGEFIVLVGPSGCGKSTTLRMIAGLEDISEGELLIDGVRMNEKHPKDRGIGMVFQSYALYPHMTAYENIAFGLRLQKLDEDEIQRRVDDVARRLEIETLLQRKPKQMSGGQRQRIAMARAIARQPSIFLFDEPLSNLDAQLRAQMRVEIRRLHQSLKATSIYVTHDQVEAMTLADRIVLLKLGEVQQIGTPLELYNQPANRFVGTFIGNPTLNVIPLEVISSPASDKSSFSVKGSGIEAPIRSELTEFIRDQNVVDVGIRPHHITVSTPEQGDFVAYLDLVEALGSESYLYCTSIPTDQDDHQQGVRLVVKVSGACPYELGTKIGLTFDPQAIHFFEHNEEGRRIG